MLLLQTEGTQFAGEGDDYSEEERALPVVTVLELQDRLKSDGNLTK